MNNDSGRTSLEIWRLNSVKKYKIIFSDIDGTLLNDENQVPKETVEELQSLDKRGIPFVLVSARMPEGMRPGRTGHSCTYGVLQWRTGIGTG